MSDRLVEVYVKAEFVDEMKTGKPLTDSAQKLQDCIRRLGEMHSANLASSPNKFVVTLRSAETTFENAIRELINCDAISGAYPKTQAYLP